MEGGDRLSAAALGPPLQCPGTHGRQQGLERRGPRRVLQVGGERVEGVGVLTQLPGGACERLRDGRLDAATPGLIDALIAATLAKLAVDNPKFSTYRRLTETPT